MDARPAGGVVVYIEVAPSRFVAVANLHLPSDPYRPYVVRDGGTAEELVPEPFDSGT